MVCRECRAAVHHGSTEDLPFAWQTRIHDHIIHNTDELNGCADYIENNVANAITVILPPSAAANSR
ncbi:MAG: hypothetical protein PUF10_00095 [Bacteroidales bacterium]|nr:hypothetical protein [Bacteroidales bacterium]